MAASTGIVGATVVTMGLLALPTMLKRGYDPAVACGTICASGTLGQIIPPSIILILLGDVISNAYSQAQMAKQQALASQGIFEYSAPQTVSVGDLFAGALIPGLLLVGLYILYIAGLALFRPDKVPAPSQQEHAELTDGNLLKQVFSALLPPLGLIIAVLGSIISGLATPTEAASVGAIGAMLLAAAKKQFNIAILRKVVVNTTEVTSMVFLILIGASIFSVVFRGFGGDELIAGYLANLPGGVFTAMFVVMLLMFVLGFVLDFIEITFVVVPIVGPILFVMGVDPVWLGIMIAINLQTSFLTPPFGFALFYLRGVAPPEVSTMTIYKGAIPFVLIQIFALGLIALWPQLATWLPDQVYGN